MHNDNESQYSGSDLNAEAWELVHNMPTAFRSIGHFIEVAKDNLNHPDQLNDPWSELDSSTAQAAFSPRVTRLADTLDRLIGEVTDTAAERGLSAGQVSELQLISGVLRRTLNASVAIAIPEAASNAASDVQKLLGLLKEQGVGLRRESEKEVRRAADSVQRLACLYHLHIAQEHVEKLRQRSLSLLEWRHSLEQPVPAPRSVNINELVKAAVRPIRPLARRRRIKLRPKLGKNLSAQVVEDEIVVAVQQLISNAIKYSDLLEEPEEAWIDIRTYDQDGDAFIAVESWGRPIAEDEIRLGRIWEPGYRGRFVRKIIHDGAGLGLPRVKRVVERNRGRISVSCVPSGQGQDPSDYEHGHFLTTFIISFPYETSAG